MIRRAPLPLGFVRVPRVTYPMADDNAPRRARAGITRFDAPALWAAIDRGDFGVAWSLEAVNQWRRQNDAPARKRANATAAALGG